MRKLLLSSILGLFLTLIVLPLLHAQRAANTPADAMAANAAPANQNSTGQAPDEVMKRLSDLVHAGKYAEAQGLTTGLLLAYPDDQRLIKAKSLLDQSLASSKAADPAASRKPPASNVISDQPAANTNSEPLTGMDKVEYNSLIELARQAQQTTDLEQQKTSLQKFMTESGPFVMEHPDEILIWQLRAASAISLNEPMAGYEAGQKLLAAGAADSKDPNLQHLMAQLNLEGWLDKKKTEVKQQEKRFGWFLGRWNVNWNWFFDNNARDQEEFVVSDSGIEGYLIGGDGVRNAEPDFRGSILDSGEMKWQYYLPPSDTGGLYVFRAKAFFFIKSTIGRRSDPKGYFKDDLHLTDKGNQQFYPSGWQPVISYEFDKDKRTMTMVISPQETDSQNKVSKQYPVTLTFNKPGNAQNQKDQ